MEIHPPVTSGDTQDEDGTSTHNLTKPFHGSAEEPLNRDVSAIGNQTEIDSSCQFLERGQSDGLACTIKQNVSRPLLRLTACPGYKGTSKASQSDGT